MFMNARQNQPVPYLHRKLAVQSMRVPPSDALTDQAVLGVNLFTGRVIVFLPD
jgi:hypothetical protein